MVSASIPCETTGWIVPYNSISSRFHPTCLAFGFWVLDSHNFSEIMYPTLFGAVLGLVGETFRRTAGITVGAQQVFFEDKGAYTGSVACSMVKSIGCEYVLCGHSERRTLFQDDDMAINLKVKKVLEGGMKPILCIGETKGTVLDIGCCTTTRQ